VTLRNFGLSFSRRSARPNAGVSWRPRHARIGFVLVLVLILIAMLAPWVAP
jgi:ABC-type dipeptide/oligopeptide/nickel transport system permease subunit